MSKEAQRKYYASNREKCNDRVLKWRKKHAWRHRVYMREYMRQRRARLKQTLPEQ